MIYAYRFYDWVSEWVPQMEDENGHKDGQQIEDDKQRGRGWRRKDIPVVPTYR